MSRRRGDDDTDVSLFPFLSILACVIGTLTLMITALALGQMDNPTVASAEQFERVRHDLAEQQSQMQQIRTELAQAEQRADNASRDLARRQQELDKLKRQVEQAMAANQQPVETPDVPVVDAAAHQAQVKRLADELARLKEQLARLQNELKDREKPPEEAVVQVRPSGSGIDFDPVFVECNAPGIVIYDTDNPLRVSRADLAESKEFLALLDRVAKRSNQTVVFLVRSNGTATYEAASNLARRRYARNGKLPVVGQGKIDLALFKQS